MSESTAVTVTPKNGAVLSPREREATLLSRSAIIPETFRNSPANVFVALEYAHRLGCSVLAVMQNLDVIHGRPSLRSTFLIGTVNACGRFTPIRFRFQGTEGKDDWGCRAVAKDRETGEECIGPLITIKMAKDEGWYQKSGSKWKTIPELMLQYRAAAWWSRLFAPDLSLGLRISEEAEDMGPPRATPLEHAQTIAAALAASDEAQDRGPDYETVSDNGNGEQVSGNGDHLADIRGRYFVMLAERGMDEDSDRHAFQARLSRDALVASPSSRNWNRQDFRSAISELDAIPVVEDATA